jgi:hypothetical protein
VQNDGDRSTWTNTEFQIPTTNSITLVYQILNHRYLRDCHHIILHLHLWLEARSLIFTMSPVDFELHKWMRATLLELKFGLKSYRFRLWLMTRIMIVRFTGPLFYCMTLLVYTTKRPQKQIAKSRLDHCSTFTRCHDITKKFKSTRMCLFTPSPWPSNRRVLNFSSAS